MSDADYRRNTGMKYIIECGGCGREITRYYLPEVVFCQDCGEGYVVDTWREVETRKYRRSEVKTQ